MAEAPAKRRRALTALLVALAALTITPIFTGVPFVSYATSGSMEPTIATFDGFLVNPWPGRIQEGDILVFDSLLHAGPAVHRVVGGDESGWLTQGDANPNPDQLAGEPLVTRERILGQVVVAPDGSPIVLPGFGYTLVSLQIQKTKLAQHAGGERQLAAYAFLAVAAVAGALTLFQKRTLPPAATLATHRRRRVLARLMPRGLLGRHVALALLGVLVCASVAAMARSTTEVDTNLVVVEDPRVADGHRSAAPEGTAQREMRIGSLGLLPTVAILEPVGDRVHVPERVASLGPWSTATLAYEIDAADVTGLQKETLKVTRYPAVFGEDLTTAMHERLPGSPYLALALTLALALHAWFRLLRIHDMPVARWLGLREDWT